MPQTRVFRDRIVSMEQTLEGGEKHLELLKSLCREALPDFDYADHALDHERDLFVIRLSAPDGRTKVVSWTRMVLFDAERIPVLFGDPGSPLRARLLQYLRSRSNRPEIVVTFRHMEEGWVDTPQPRREKRRRRKGRPERRGEAARRPEKLAPSRRPEKAQTPRRETPPSAPARRVDAPAAAGGSGEASAGRPVGRRRFRRRRRGGRGGAGGPAQGPAAP